MSGGKSTTYSNNFLTWALTTAVAPTRPTSFTVALYTDVTGRSVAPVTEATTGNCPGYARQTVSFGSSAATGGTISNSGSATAFTATGAWATVNYYGVLDQSGNMIYWAPLSTSRTLQVSGDQISFAVGSITVTEA